MSADATLEFAMTWTWLRGPSPPDAPLADCVNFALMSCFTCNLVRYNSCLSVEEACLSNSTTSEEEDGQQHEEHAPWMYSVNNSCDECRQDTDWRERLVRPSSVNKCCNCWYCNKWLHDVCRVKLQCGEPEAVVSLTLSMASHFR